MIDLDHLLAQCDALEAAPADSQAVLAHSRCLRESIELLYHQNRRLSARQASLEAQVMDLAQVPELSPDWWDKVLYFSQDHIDNILAFDFDDDLPPAG